MWPSPKQSRVPSGDTPGVSPHTCGLAAGPTRDKPRDAGHDGEQDVG